MLVDRPASVKQTGIRRVIEKPPVNER